MCEPDWKSMYEDMKELYDNCKINNKELLLKNTRLFNRKELLEDKIKEFISDVGYIN